MSLSGMTLSHILIDNADSIYAKELCVKQKMKKVKNPCSGLSCGGLFPPDSRPDTLICRCAFA